MKKKTSKKNPPGLDTAALMDALKASGRLHVVPPDEHWGPQYRYAEENGTLVHTQFNFQSTRRATLRDDGRCGWLYLSGPHDSDKLAASCWLYNRVEAPETADEAAVAKGLPTPAPRGQLKDPRPSEPPKSPWFRWGNNGNSVAVIDGSTVYGYVVAGRTRGRSLELVGETPFGAEIDWDEFEDVFKMVL